MIDRRKELEIEIYVADLAEQCSIKTKEVVIVLEGEKHNAE